MLATYIAAVSTLSTLLPNVVALNPFSIRKSSSFLENPPSGPMINRILLY